MFNVSSDRKIKAIIFDLDGTLVDSIEVFCRDINKVFSVVGLPLVDKETVVKTMQSGKNPWEALVPAEVKDREKIVRRCIELDEKFFPELYLDAKLLPEVYETLEKISKKKIPMGIATSLWGDPIFKLLEKHGVHRFIKTVVTKPDVSRNKPAPDMVIECAKRLGFPPENCMYVGDSPLDVKAGKAAGMITVAIPTEVSNMETLKQEKPDFIIEKMGKLTSILKRFGIDF